MKSKLRQVSSQRWFWPVIILIVLAGGLLYFTYPTKQDLEPSLSDESSETPLRTVTQTRLVVYEGPSVMKSSDRVQIQVEDQELFVYETLVNHGRVFSFTAPTTTTPVALFDFEGSVTVTVTVDEGVERAVVRPLAYGIQPQIEGDTITFTLDYPGNYTVEYNGRTDRAIHLFANPLEEDAPDPDNIPDDMIYIGPGVYKADAIPVKSNQTIYIAGGAVVYGQIRGQEVENVTIRGRGIIDGSIYPRTRAAEFTIPVEFRHSKNITIEGLTFLDPAGWAISSYFVDGLTIDNVKIITARANGDGISIQSSKNVEVKNSFVRTWDDSLVVKNYDRGTTSNVLFENMVLWTDLAQSMEIGYETYGETMENIEFRDITVLHNFHKPVISIHNSDDAVIRDVVFRNITVEDGQIVGDNMAASYDNFFLDFAIQYNQEWTRSGGERGEIKDVVVDNILVLDGRDDFVSRIMGSGPQNKVSNVVLRNITYKDTQVKKGEDFHLSVNEHTENIRVEFPAKESTGARLYLPYKLALEKNAEQQITVVTQPEQTGYVVPAFAMKDLPEIYIGQKITGEFEVTATRGTSTREWDDGSGSFATAPNVPSNVLDGDLSTKWMGLEWSGETGEFGALNIWFDEPQTVGTIRVYGDPESSLYLKQNIGVFGVRATSTKDVFTRILNSKDYEFTPAAGNFVDIKINPGEYKGIQLRFYNREGTAYPKRAFAHGVDIYPASLTFNQAVSASPHEDIYVANHITDGNPLTYYEAKKDHWPAEVVVDMGESWTVRYVNVALPPLMQWEPRTQTFSIEASLGGEEYEEIVPQGDYLFDPAKGNVVEIPLGEGVEARFLKFVFTRNTAPGGFGAQVSEISAFE